MENFDKDQFILKVEEQYDIDQLKNIVDVSANVIDTFVHLDANQDGVISSDETFAALAKVAMQVPTIQQAIPELAKEIEDLETEEINDLVKYIVIKLDRIENQKIRKSIKWTLLYLRSTYNYIVRMRKLHAPEANTEDIA